MESAYFVNNSKEASFKLRLRTVFFLFFDHRRTGKGGGGVGARGAAAPPNFGQHRFFGQREKIWATSVFKDVSMFI